MPKRVLLIGFGKMGKELLSLLPRYDFQPVFIWSRTQPSPSPSCPWSSSPSDIPWNSIDLAIDFSSPENIKERLHTIFEKKIPLVQGTTGWETSREHILNEANETGSSLVWANNFSLGVSLFKEIVRYASELFKPFPEFDCGLMEVHHRKKQDAPSGTLLSLKEALGEKQIAASRTTGSIPSNTIDTATLRVGHVPGYHSLWIDGPQETIQITHSARSRAVFAEGALLAATYLLQHPGVWHFDQLLRQNKEKNHV